MLSIYDFYLIPYINKKDKVFNNMVKELAENQIDSHKQVKGT